MTTVCLAWIDAKYQKKFEMVYFGTVCIDIVSIIAVAICNYGP
jgi:hypothetical protein